MREAIESALGQTYENCEVIVINDGSNDEGKTHKIAINYGDRIRYFLKENGGVSSALNAGIAIMKGEYFSWLSHDDVYYPEKIEKQVHDLMKNKAESNNVLSLCDWNRVDKDLKPISRQGKRKRNYNQILDGTEVLEMLFKEGTFNGCALLIPKEVFNKCGLFDTSLRFNQDSFMWCKIFLSGYRLVCTQNLGVLQRMHDSQLTQTGQSIFHRDCLYMSETLIPALLAISSTENNLLLYYAFYNAKHNNALVVSNALAVSKTINLIGWHDRLKVRIILLYGKARPSLRKLYYRVFIERKSF